MDYSLPGFSVHGDSPDKNTEVGCHVPLQGIFPTQGSNPGLLHCRRILYWPEPSGKPNDCVQFSSVAQLCPTLHDPMNCSTSLSITNSRSSLKLVSIESVMPSSHLILCHPLLLLPPIPPGIRVFSNESVLCISGQSTGVSALTSVLPKNTQS